MRTISLLFLITASCLFAPDVRATAVFTNIDATVCHCGSDVVVGFVGAGPNSWAEAFTPTTNYMLTSAELRLDAYPGGAVNVWLYSNANGAPGSMLDGLGGIIVAPGNGGLFTTSFLAGPLLLKSGVEYWLALTPQVPMASVQWEGAGSQDVPTATTSDPNGITGWSAVGPTAGQFQINGNPAAAAVPETATFFLILPALALLAVVQRKVGVSQ